MLSGLRVKSREKGSRRRDWQQKVGMIVGHNGMSVVSWVSVYQEWPRKQTKMSVSQTSLRKQREGSVASV